MIYSANYSLKEPQKNVDLADVNDINYNTEAIDGLIHNTQISLAPAYDQTSTYAVDDLVMYENLLYKCITAITVAEAWDSTKWERAYLSENAGGGGNANVTEITYAQYQALTPAEKTNGTIYAVTNDPNDSSSGGGGGGMNYSLSEQIIGEWVDGNALYQRTFPIVANDAWIDISACNINEIVDIGGNWVTTSGASLPVTMFAGDQWYSFVDLEIVNERMRLRQFGWTFSSGYITLQYTKTS